MRHVHPLASARWSVGAVAVLLMLAGTLAACGGSSSSDESSSKATRSAGTGTPGVPPDPSVMSGFTCQPDEAGVWSAQMTLVNSTGAAASYLARVAIITTATSDVVGRQTKRVVLDADDSITVPFDDLANGGSEGLMCEPRALVVED